VLTIGGVVVAAVVAALVVCIVRSGKLTGASGVSGIYGRMCLCGRLIGARAEAWQTPHEYAAVLAESIPPGARLVERIADLYVRDRFSPRGVGPKEEQEAEGAWKVLRPIIWRALTGRGLFLVRSQLSVGAARTKIQQRSVQR
jgi:hypothetical protein